MFIVISLLKSLHKKYLPRYYLGITTIQIFCLGTFNVIFVVTNLLHVNS